MQVTTKSAAAKLVTIRVGNIGNDEIRGGLGDDSLYGHEGDDVLLAGEGNDGAWRYGP